MKRTWSDSRKWAGFQATRYSIDDRALDLSLERLSPDPLGELKSQTVTVGDILLEFKGQPPANVETFLEVKSIGGRPYTELGGAPFNLELANTLLRLQADGVHPFSASWYWYEEDSLVTGSVHDTYYFFVVHDGRIVSERASFADYPEAGFDPSIFKAPDFTRRLYFHDADWQRASIRYWYRHFYEDTRTGQLMILRPDSPQLFFYEQGRWTAQTAFASLEQQLASLRWRINLVLLLLLVIALLLWK